MRVLDYDGLAFFWDNLKAYIGTNVKTVNFIGPNANGNVTLAAAHIHYDNETSQLVAQNVQDALDELDMNLNYNAIYEFDATVTSAPPNLPRGYNWHVDWLDDEYGDPLPLEGEYNYRRFFYLSREDAQSEDLEFGGNPNYAKAVAAWVISNGDDNDPQPGRRVVFEYWSGGNRVNIVELTNEDGTVVLRPRYRPIPVGDVWFFGNQQGTDEFPKNDNIRSIVDINVEGIWLHLGNPLEFVTADPPITDPTIVGAIKEINARQASVRILKAETAQEALIESQKPENKDVFVYVAREQVQP
jgi:hypothetical protein